MKTQGIYHVGVIVNNLAAAKAFFSRLNTRSPGRVESRGDQVIGLDNVKNAAAMLGMPGGPATIKLAESLAFHPLLNDERTLQMTNPCGAACAGG